MTEEFAGEIDWPAIEAKWHLEPELRQKIPRRVAARGEKSGCGGRFFGCFLLPMLSLMLCTGLMMSIWAGLALLILPFGSQTGGVVTRHEMTVSSGRRKGTESFFLHFRFAHGGQKYGGEWPVSRSIYTKTLDGDAVKVRFFPFAPGLRPLIESGASPWFSVWGLGPLGLLMVGVSGLILPSLFQIKHGRKLVRGGVATPAMVVSRTNAEAGDRTMISYLFRANGQTWEKTRQMNSVEPISGQVGTVFTVLHHPKHPRRALIYRLCDYRARD